MDLLAIAVDDVVRALREGDWVELDYDLPDAGRAIGPQPI